MCITGAPAFPPNPLASGMEAPKEEAAAGGAGAEESVLLPPIEAAAAAAAAAAKEVRDTYTPTAAQQEAIKAVAAGLVSALRDLPYQQPETRALALVLAMGAAGEPMRDIVAVLCRAAIAYPEFQKAFRVMMPQGLPQAIAGYPDIYAALKRDVSECIRCASPPPRAGAGGAGGGGAAGGAAAAAIPAAGAGAGPA